MGFNLNVDGAWRADAKMHCNVDGAWREAKKGWVNVDGVWREFYSSGASRGLYYIQSTSSLMQIDTDTLINIGAVSLSPPLPYSTDIVSVCGDKLYQLIKSWRRNTPGEFAELDFETRAQLRTAEIPNPNWTETKEDAGIRNSDADEVEVIFAGYFKSGSPSYRPTGSRFDRNTLAVLGSIPTISGSTRDGLIYSLTMYPNIYSIYGDPWTSNTTEIARTNLSTGARTQPFFRDGKGVPHGAGCDGVSLFFFNYISSTAYLNKVSAEGMLIKSVSRRSQASLFGFREG